ncbi:hypothetical protein Tco_1192180 [Tanacetum coccineum]
MTRQYYIPIHSLDIPENSWTLVQFMEYVKKSIDERALHKMEYDNRVNERQTQTTEEKIDTSNALDVLDASLVIIESNGTESQKPDTSSRSRNDADIRPIYDEEPMTENADQCYDTRPLPAKLTDNHDTELQINSRAKNIGHTTSLIANNDKFKAQLQEKGFAIAALKNELKKLTGNSVNTKFAKSSILRKPDLQPRRNQSVVRQPTAFKSDDHRNFQKPTERESAVAKPHHMIAPGSSRWKPTGRVFKNVVLRWVPTGKTFASSTTNVDSEPPNGSNADITNQCESEQALDVSACTLLSTSTSFNPIKEGLRVWLRKRQISQKTGLQGILI